MALSTPKMARFLTPAKHLQSNLVSKVRVIVRVRPFLPYEIEAKDGNPITCVSLINPECGSGIEVSVHLKDQETSRNECYNLDSFFGQEGDTVSLIFHKEVSPLIPGIFLGCNATVFAYGATGSGKTHTMQGTDELPGLMPLSMSAVLSMCESTRSIAEISYYEVYMDRCYDLLEPKTREILVLDDKDGQIHLKGLSRVPVNSMTEFYQIFSCGIQRRKVAHTGLNDVSSRSHGVLVISVSSPGDNGSGVVVTGKLNLIDLAGNEDNRRTCNEGIRLQESAKINQSLFALSNVIYALNNNLPRVPYRESKLTRILQDSLGGTSRSLMVACLNPGEYQESVHTVSLAARSRQILNYVSSAHKQDTPKAKVDMEAKLCAWLESKGKTKSVHRIGAFGSPFPSKTPISVSSVAKLSNCQISGRANVATNQTASNAKARNLFNDGCPLVSSMEDTCLFHKGEDSKDCFGITKDKGSTILKDESFKVLATTPSYVDARLNIYNSLDFTGTETYIEEENKDASRSFSMMEPMTYLCDQSFDKEEETTIVSANTVGSPTISERLKASQNSLRKALSPINSNISIKPLDDLSSKDERYSVFFEPKTPKTPYVLTNKSIGFQTTGTPLDKFNAQSSNLKSSLVQEYLAFLNSASKEELLELKGIGHKRAEYIMELRETSPLKSLCDLEYIGLSSKQVHGMFRRTARGIFD
ncbi:hypothetical protein HHK36_011003 [Tetracentron sinense]|uniref:Kinesin-like protein n=1 Tax=Tetracentron sinense TaxID=13715 RepID=A0A834ZB97_TETSI|nr:hypothetical protein HHK36_011003 [Tetracentron sinense]